MKTDTLWKRYCDFTFFDKDLNFSLDVSRMNFPDGFWAELEPRLQDAYRAMDALEAGALANPDEGRMVGHYWLRAPAMAPDGWPEAIQSTLKRIKAFAAQVHDGELRCEQSKLFRNLLIIGIGGSALGPQFVANALSHPTTDKMRPFFFDNTDPDGIDRTLARIGGGLAQTLTVVISKSGGTRETRNGLLEAQAAYHEAGLHFGRHAVAITGEGSQLDEVAKSERWLARFPMWDWVGGRTSETSAVGLLPAALQGFDIDALLAGAARMDALTRRHQTQQNPAAMLAAMWYFATGGHGKKDMVILPYKDRLELFPRYLQQLVMESLGKAKDLDGKVVHQGLTVYGNKGSTDQHAYVQQLRDGVANFFVTFIEVLEKRASGALEVEPEIRTGDYLTGFLYGTRRALYENGRGSITLTIPAASAATVGQLIALYERAVGLYATLINVNAYHQPGVEAGKKAAEEFLQLQKAVEGVLRAQPGAALTAPEIAAHLGEPEKTEDVFHILRHLAATRRAKCQSGEGAEAAYQI
jgi:glucose-6-phosphate isomerase